MDLNQRFPFLSDSERAIIIGFENGSTSSQQVVELLLKLADNFRAAANQTEKISTRAKLLGLAGLYEAIPVERFEKAKRAPLSLNFVELKIETDEDPLQALIRCGEIPLDLLVNFPGLKEFFLIRNPQGKSYQQTVIDAQTLLGGVTVVFKSNINDEVVGYVSSSSEPLTRSILINPFVDSPERGLRDFASMAYDILMQLEFLEIFYRSHDRLDRVAIQASMRIEGLKFVFDVFAVLVDRAQVAKHISLEIREKEVLLRSRGGPESLELCHYLNYLLYSLGGSTIEQITQILGIQESEREIGKVLLEHPLQFDPRKIQMKIIT